MYYIISPTEGGIMYMTLMVAGLLGENGGFRAVKVDQLISNEE